MVSCACKDQGKEHHILWIWSYKQLWASQPGCWKLHSSPLQEPGVFLTLSHHSSQDHRILLLKRNYLFMLGDGKQRQKMYVYMRLQISDLAQMIHVNKYSDRPKSYN